MAILIRLFSDFNQRNSALLQKRLKKSLATKSERSCVVDLGTIDSISNYGLMTLVALHRIAHNNGCNLYLMNLNDSVKYCLEVTGLDQRFQIKQNQGEFSYSQAYN
ncbi:MAG: STAS domain-containing protein [Microcoleaceae cyanobacterium MO_207.B10]|nr:STAS domain-containing protein [Microcoleaceae cyanobacterium MO_207.B10]